MKVYEMFQKEPEVITSQLQSLSKIKYASSNEYWKSSNNTYQTWIETKSEWQKKTNEQNTNKINQVSNVVVLWPIQCNTTLLKRSEKTDFIS